MVSHNSRLFGAKALVLFAGMFGLAIGEAALAQQTNTHTYDALGRLIATTTTGGTNNGETRSLCYDPAGNRTQVKASSDFSTANCAAPPPPPPPANTPPVAVNDSASGLCNTTQIVNVVANDYDPDGHTPLALVSVTPGNNTDASVSSSTSLAVTGWLPGTEYIYYVVRDSQGATATGRLTYTTTGTSQQCFQ